MSGEMRLVRSAMLWGFIALPPAVGLAFLLRDAAGAISVAIAAGLVLANAALAGWISAFAGRRSTAAAAFASLPSFGVRMVLIFTSMAALRDQTFIDPPTFALTFGVAVTIVLFAESRTWGRTPWIGLTLKEKS